MLLVLSRKWIIGEDVSDQTKCRTAHMWLESFIEKVSSQRYEYSTRRSTEYTHFYRLAHDNDKKVRTICAVYHACMPCKLGIGIPSIYRYRYTAKFIAEIRSFLCAHDDFSMTGSVTTCA